MLRWLDGGSFGDGIVNGLVGAGTGALIGGATGGLFSGVKASVQGRNFWTGAKPWQAPSITQLPRPDALGSADDWTAPRSTLKNLPGQQPGTQLPDPVRLQGGDFTGKLPVGKPGSYLNAIGSNKATTINGFRFTGHALDQMQGRGILSPSAVIDVIKNPAVVQPGSQPGTAIFIRNNLKIVTDQTHRNIITVIKVRPR